MSNYRAIALDLCDTLFLIRVERLPSVRLGDRAVRSTAPLLYPLLQEVAPQVEEENFTRTLHRIAEELDEKKRVEGREIPAGVRYERTLQALGIAPGEKTTTLLFRLVETHTAALLETMECPPSHIRLLRTLAGRRLALVTNFDHPRSVHRLLAREGIADCFHAIVVSGEVGWRKPRPEIFLAALKGLDVTPFECLYVGDDFEKDIRGASAVGMPAVWLNEHAEPLPVEGPFPLATIRALPELTDILRFEAKGWRQKILP